MSHSTQVLLGSEDSAAARLAKAAKVFKLLRVARMFRLLRVQARDSRARAFPPPLSLSPRGPSPP